MLLHPMRWEILLSAHVLAVEKLSRFVVAAVTSGDHARRCEREESIRRGFCRG